MGKSITERNMRMALAVQLCGVVHGFLLPKIILTCFGSEVNGMVSSVAQYLSGIQILEGGLGAVVMASLYKPLAERNMDKVSAIVRAAEQFFRKLALTYLVYALIVAIVFPRLVQTQFSPGYITALVLVIALGTFVQYFFATPYRLLIQADKHGHVVSFAYILMLLCSTALALVAALTRQSVHVIRLIGSVCYGICPVVFCLYVRRHYPLKKDVQPDREALKQRWDAFGQNLAYFINNNTDLVLLSLFATLPEISVYSVYALIVVALRNLVKSLSEAAAPSVGRELVTSSSLRLNRIFDWYELGMNALSTVVFSCCMVLIVPFVKIYTAGLWDADYNQPMLACLLTLANWVYCCRESLRSMIHIAGHIRQTSWAAYMEAGINVVLSAFLVGKFGLVGVGIGTAVVMVYRMICMAWYLKKNILYRPLRKWAKGLAVFACAGAVSVILARRIPILIYNYASWFSFAVVTGVISAAVVAAFVLLFYWKQVRQLFLK